MESNSPSFFSIQYIYIASNGVLERRLRNIIHGLRLRATCAIENQFHEEKVTDSERKTIKLVRVISFRYSTMIVVLEGGGVLRVFLRVSLYGIGL